MSANIARRFGAILLLCVCGTGAAESSAETVDLSDPRQLSTPARAALAAVQLHTLMITAIERSPAVREARALARSAGFSVAEAEGARYPQVSLDADSRWSDGASPVSGRELNGRPSVNLSMNLPVFNAGRIDSVVESRVSSEQALRARIDAAMLNVAGEATLAAIERTRLAKQLVEADRYIERIQTLVDMLSRITEADRGRAGELTQARARVLQAQVTRASLASRLEQAELFLQKWVGPTPREVGLVCLAFLSPEGPDGLIKALVHHPAIRQTTHEVRAEQSNARAVWAAQMPQVSLVASRTPLAAGLSGQYVAYAGVSLNFPLFKGFSGQAAERAAAERAIGALERRDQQMTDRTTSVRTLHASALAQLRRAEEFSALLRESDQVRRDFFTQWHEIGRRSLFELLAAESEFFSLQISYYDTLFDGLSGLARLSVESGALLGQLGRTGPNEQEETK